MLIISRIVSVLAEEIEFRAFFVGKGNGGTTSISGGVVIAASTQKGAGIGGGNDGDGGTVNISGGHVTASGGYLKYDHWEAYIKPDYMDAIKGLPDGGNPYRAMTFTAAAIMIKIKSDLPERLWQR